MGYKTIQLRKLKEQIGVITFLREIDMNTLSIEFIGELCDAVEEIRSDKNIKVLILTGEGKVFCCGAEVTYFVGETRLDTLQSRAYLKKIVGLFEMIESFEKPTIAAINGYALGGGCEMAIACDFRVMSDHAKIGVPEVLLAAVAGGGGTMRLPRLVGVGKALEMNLLGTHLDAREALEVGLVTKVSAHGRLMQEAENLALKLAQNSAMAMYMIKSSIHQGIYGDKQSSVAYALECMLSCYDHPDQKEVAMPAFLRKQKAYFNGLSFGLK